MRVGLVLIFLSSVFAQESHWKFSGDSEGQVNSSGENLYYSQFLFEQRGHLLLMQRFFLSQRRMPRHELGLGWVFEVKKLGPCVNMKFRPYSGWADEGSHYWLSTFVGSGECLGHKALVIIDRKNRIVGQRGTFEYHRASLQVYKWLWFRWDGTYKNVSPLKKTWAWISNQPGVEVEVPLGKRWKAFASVQRDYLMPNGRGFGKNVSHFGFRF